MKLIDDKGRVFGLINIIDLFVLILVIMFIGGSIALNHKINNKITNEETVIATPKYKKYWLIHKKSGEAEMIGETATIMRFYNEYPDEFNKYYELIEIR